ncbi:hypothetical protein GOB19_27485 [Sinorhizobium meliloti]|nr:hypothetical protein [Sinorhizobium meliloti]
MQNKHRHKKTLACLAFSAGLFGVGPVRAQEVQDLIEQIFQRAVLKVDVSAPRSVFDDNGDNICKSEGTAFVIGEQFAVTATHVYALDPACGTPVISLESKGFNTEVFAEVFAVSDDVTLLKFSGPLPEPTCALAISNSDVTFVQGMRFGIPGGMYYPSPMPVRIGSNESDFKPFVQLTPTPAERGESGGPVVYMFNVVGILRAKHAKYPAFSVMTPISQLRTLLAEKAIPLHARLCDPVEVTIFQPQATYFEAKVRVPTSAAPTAIELQQMIEAGRSRGFEVASFPSSDGRTTIEVSARSRRERSEDGFLINPQSDFEHFERYGIYESFARIREFAGQIAEAARIRTWHQYVSAVQADKPQSAYPAQVGPPTAD